jgi:hypothetical protein
MILLKALEALRYKSIYVIFGAKLLSMPLRHCIRIYVKKKLNALEFQKYHMNFNAYSAYMIVPNILTKPTN